MKRFKALAIGLAFCAAMAISATALTVSPLAQNSNQSCCDSPNCCKDGTMSCCKKKSKGKNAHACCKGKDNAESCCCKGDSCPMPNKKTQNTNTN